MAGPTQTAGEWESPSRGLSEVGVLEVSLRAGSAKLQV